MVLAALHQFLHVIEGFLLQLSDGGEVGLGFRLATQLHEDLRTQVMNAGAIRIDGNGVVDGFERISYAALLPIDFGQSVPGSTNAGLALHGLLEIALRFLILLQQVGDDAELIVIVGDGVVRHRRSGLEVLVPRELFLRLFKIPLSTVGQPQVVVDVGQFVVALRGAIQFGNRLILLASREVAPSHQQMEGRACRC